MKQTNLLLLLAVISFLRPVVAQGCDLTLIPINFGAYNMLSGFPLDTTGSIEVNCAVSGIAYRVILGPGKDSAGSLRKMRDSEGIDTLTYNLYTDAARTIIWGDGTVGTVTQSAVSSQIVRRFNIHGRIGAGQNVKPGLYSDQVIVTVEW
ncbi:MAG: spore coat protein U domain-containing protein [Proteobacteria bacterium]|nr:spore coat protein U domain-containing protein [Pseudomonadota bacterium]